MKPGTGPLTGAGQRVKRWALLSGEYPPVAGGVADYTAQLAAALANAGDDVHVWAPEPARAVDGETVHPLADRFGSRSRRDIEREWAGLGPGLQILVQYVPHAFGRKGMNLGFTSWLARQRERGIWVMFHEVAFPSERAQPLRHRLLARVTGRMAAQLYGAAARAFVAIPAWGEMLKALAPNGREPEWLPVASNLPTSVPEREREQARRRAGVGDDTTVVGWFGGRLDAYARTWMTATLMQLLRTNAKRVAMLSGSAGPSLRDDIVAADAGLADRIFAPGSRPAPDTAAQLAASDLVIAAYPDGVSSRRGTAMAALGLGRPLLTTCGHLSETVWRDAGVALVDASAPEGLAAAAEALLGDPARRQDLGIAGQQLYQRWFALEHTVARLRNAGAATAAGGGR